MTAESFRARKSLGQHFLVDPNISRKIAAAINPQPGETIIEIGPGKGALTAHLVGKGARVIAVDVDERAVELLHGLAEERRWEGIDIRNGDILETDLGSLAQGSPIRVVGNLPYNITSPVFFRLFSFHALVSDCLFMIQREVAERICSGPGSKTYGILSVLTKVHGDAKIAFHVPPTVFRPQPKVWSSVIAVRFQSERLKSISDYGHFVRTVKGAFGKRRKTLLNSLRFAGFDLKQDLGEIERFMTLRPEQLSVDDFIHLSNSLPR